MMNFSKIEVIDNLAPFRVLIFKEGQIFFSKMRGLNFIAAHQVCFIFQTSCSILKHKRLKGKWCQKLMPNFALFDPL